MGKPTIWSFEGLINFLVILGPVGLMVDGVIGMWQDQPLHPDAFVLFGGLLMGALSLVTLGAYLVVWLVNGRKHVPLFRKLLCAFYGVWIVLGIGLALTVTETLPPMGIFKWFY